MKVSIGIGSWSDKEYVGLLFRKGLPAGEHLKALSRIFDRVEVNSTYYGTPKLETVKEWVRQTPPEFLFDIKLHKAIAQSPGKFGKEKGDLVGLMLENLQPLIRAKKLGTFVFMLSPYFQPDRNGIEELDGVIAALKPHSIAVEVRNRDWVAGRQKAKTLDYLRERNVAWVTVDMPPVDKPGVMPALDEVTSPQLAYLRLHGRNKNWLKAKTAGERHLYLYSGEELEEIVTRIKHLAKKAETVRVVANNHAKNYAPRTALALREMLGQPGFKLGSVQDDDADFKLE